MKRRRRSRRFCTSSAHVQVYTGISSHRSTAMAMNRFSSLSRNAAMALCLVFALPALASEPAPRPGQAGYETFYMEHMVDHHGMAVAMAGLCEQKAVHSELLALCADMGIAQQQEIDMLQDWLLDWYGRTHRPEMSPSDERQLVRLSQLSGGAFETEFMDMMVQHHHTAIVRSSVCLMRAYHGALIGMCEDMIQSQLDETRMMKTWLCRWYGRCPEA